VVISNGTIDTTSTGIRDGETNKSVAGPPVDINGVTITNALHDAQNGDVENVSQSVLTVNGTAGNDTYIASPETTGSIVFHGSAGNDTLTGGAGNDVIDGGAGDDEIRPDAGNDVVHAGAGNDSIHAFGGGHHDYVDCGPGKDTAYVDKGERTRRCERVKHR
jgi:Ca2+-binding RTX toxin-like protein